MLHIALYQPEIPPNTGNILRLCHNTGARLHLIHPLGFSLEEKQLRRAGLDYIHPELFVEHADWTSFEQWRADRRLLSFSTHHAVRYSDCRYRDEDVLLFGPETRGLPDDILEAQAEGCCLTLPMQPDSRSLNLSNSVAIALYEAWRQLDFKLT